MNRAIIAVLLVVPLAGCLGADSEPLSRDPLDRDGPLPALFGLTLDERGEPLEGVRISIPDFNLDTRSDEEGAFEFQDVPFEGRVGLIASKEGHAAARTEVVMAPELAARVVFTLLNLDNAHSMLTYYDFNGFLPCNVIAPTFGAQDCPEPFGGPSRDSFRIPLDLHVGEMLESLEVTMDWKSTSMGTEDLHIQVLLDDGTLLWEEVGTSPLTVTFEDQDAARIQDVGVLRIEVGLDPELPGFALAQRFNGLMTQSTLLVE